MTNYIDLLKNYDLTVTPQRLSLVEIIYKHGHIDIDNLYKLIIKKFPNLSLATIYKNLNKMIEVGFLEEVKIDNRKSVFEIKKDSHSHLVCSSCGSVTDIDTPKLDTKKLLLNSNFKVEDLNLTFYGNCEKCI